MSDVTTAIEYELKKHHPEADHITVLEDRLWRSETILNGAPRYEVHFAENMVFKTLYFWVDSITNEVVAISRYASGG